jgi:hypothetical protein
VLVVLLVPLVPVAGLLFLLGAERLERIDKSGLRQFARSQSALGDTVDRVREVD